MALRRGEAHLAPTHLLDEETGVYNVSYLKRLFSEPMALVKGVDRIQGIMVQKGNPLSIRGVEDLPRVSYVNRQRGAGTRVLLDYKLKQAGIDPESIKGYDREAATHMAVAAAIQGGSATREWESPRLRRPWGLILSRSGRRSTISPSRCGSSLFPM